jgi:hypothetical protein
MRRCGRRKENGWNKHRREQRDEKMRTEKRNRMEQTYVRTVGREEVEVAKNRDGTTHHDDCTRKSLQ